MIEVEQSRVLQPPCESKGARHVAASPVLAAVPVSGCVSRRGKSCHKQPVALIDEFPLRRASALNLLRAHMREGAQPFRDAAEFLMQAPGAAHCGVVVSVGGRSVTEVPLREQLQCLRRALASTPVVVLSDRDEPEEVVAVFREGARGYVPTSLEPRLVIEAIRMVVAGGTFVPVEVMVRLRCKMPPVSQQQPICPAEVYVPNDHRGQWPPRQLAVLNLLVQGRANKEIARALAMEESTVKVHVRHIMRKLGAVNRTQAALRARRLGITATANGVPVPAAQQAHYASAPAAPT